MACQLHSLPHCTLIYDDSNVTGSTFKLKMHVVLGKKKCLLGGPVAIVLSCEICKGQITQCVWMWQWDNPEGLLLQLARGPPVPAHLQRLKFSNRILTSAQIYFDEEKRTPKPL